MAIWEDSAGGLHDDMGGAALGLPTWPQGMTKLTDVEAAAARAPTLAQAQAQQTQTLSASCQAQIYAGFSSSALGATHSYPAQDTDQMNLASSVLASLMPNLAADWTTPFKCADANGVWAFRNHTAAQIQQVGQDGKAAILAAMAQNATLAAEVAAATTVAAVQAIVWTAPGNLPSTRASGPGSTGL